MEFKEKLDYRTMETFSRRIYNNQFELFEQFFEFWLVANEIFCFSRKKMSLICHTVDLCVFSCIDDRFFDNLDTDQT
jgi:hypothetical protein